MHTIGMKIPRKCPLCGADMKTVSPLLHALEHKKARKIEKEN